MANLVKHRFVSAKSDGPDVTQVQPTNWNDGHVFTGGNAGDVLTRDPIDAAFGARWAKPSDSLVWSDRGVDVSSVPVVLSIATIAAGQVATSDSIVVELEIVIAGEISTPPIFDLLVAPAVHPPFVAWVFTGANGAGDFPTNGMGCFDVAIHQSASSDVYLQSLGSGAIVVGVTQARGFVFTNVSGVLTGGITTAWQLYLREIAGLPAGTSAYWAWRVYHRRGSV